MTAKVARSLLATALAMATTGAAAQSYDDEQRPWTVPAIPTAVNAAANFVPEGWRLVSIQHGDLNRDRRDDAIVLMRMADPSRIVETSNTTHAMDNQNPYLLVVAFRDGPAGFRRVTVSRALLESFHGPADAAAEANDGWVSVQRGALVIEKEYIRSHETYRFRWKGHQFGLIGFDCAGVVGGTFGSLSANYLTGRAKLERGPVDSDKLTSWFVRIKPGKRPTLDSNDWDGDWIGNDTSGGPLSC